MLTPERENKILRRLLKKKSVDDFSAEELGRKAHWRWNRGEHLEAAVLFDAAAVRREREVRLAPTSRDNTFNYRVRAGVNFRMAGEVERAWPILMEATTFDWDAAGLPEDSHFTEWAFVEMLQVMAENDDRSRFSELFWRAVTRCDELGFAFPMIRPKQELLLETCVRLGLRMELARVIERIEVQGKLSRSLARRVVEVKMVMFANNAEQSL